MNDIHVLMYLGSQAFFNAMVEQGNKLIENTARCTLLVASRLNLEFTFAGETKLIDNGMELLNEVVAAAKAGKFTQADADFAVYQLSRISLRYNSTRTLYHVQAYKDVQDAPVPVLLDVKPSDVVAENLPDAPVKKGGRPAKKV
jgi:hypothetical protein